MARQTTGVTVLLAELVLFLLILPVFLVLAVFTVPLIVMLAPIFVAWAVAQGGAGHPHMPGRYHPRQAARPLEPAHQH